MPGYKKIIKWALIVVFSVLIALLSMSYLLFRSSLPHLSGELKIAGLSAPVHVDRDAQGIPAIYGANRTDVARATGFVHAQDRYFQMDLLRKSSAGELSELFGERLIDYDKERRFHRIRALAQHLLPTLSEDEQALLKAYAEGVNAGLQSLTALPFEYWLLRVDPAPWQAEDSILVGFALFFALQDHDGKTDLTRGYMHQALPPATYDFFIKTGSAWEAALDDSQSPILPIPGPEFFAYLQKAVPSDEVTDALSKEAATEEGEIPLGGSNHWVVSGQHTADQKALLACDMHLALSVPHIWYRTAFHFLDPQGRQANVYGVTLPGLPCMVIGSNTKIAWGYTNAYMDTTDVAILELDPQNSNRYRTEQGFQEFKTYHELIKVKGQDPVQYDIDTTIWGPVMPKSYLGNRTALMWVAHNPKAINMRMIDLETASDTADALTRVKKIQIPLLNIVIADSKGHIGWTIVGALPARKGFDGLLPERFGDGEKSWDGLLDRSNYPVMMNPPEGRLWVANNRMLGNQWAAFIGSEGFMNGIRAYQVREKLLALKEASPRDMLAIQLDDDAPFFNRWQQLLLSLLPEDDSSPEHLAVRKEVAQWNGRASSDSSGYFWIRRFREETVKQVLNRFISPCFEGLEGFPCRHRDFEESVWMLVSQQPEYLADPNYGSWKKELISILDTLLQTQQATVASIPQQTWGPHNALKMQHPISRAIPLLSPFLDMPNDPQDGDFFMPRVATPQNGASQRMVVSPGKEAEGIFHCPGGQSGHPLSPYYREGHAAWAQGAPSPFLPGPAVNKLTLSPL